MTRLLLTKIPFFREIIVSSFSCEHCGWNNTEIQSAGRIQDQGVRYTLTVRAQEVRGAHSSYPSVLEKAWGLESELWSRWFSWTLRKSLLSVQTPVSSFVK